MKVRFYRCSICGNIVTKMVDGGVNPTCCGEEMEELVSNTTDGKHEFHVPVMEKFDDGKVLVKIGKEPHPMRKEHFIEFIFIETCDRNGRSGGIFAWLNPEEEPSHVFCACAAEITNIFEYCSVHGLWKFQVQCNKKHCES